MADKIFPLFSQNDSATITLDIDNEATAKTHKYVVDSRTVLIDAAGADVAPTHTVNIQGEVGLVFFVDITSLNKDTDTAAATVVFAKGDNTITFDAETEAASVMITESGLQDATDLLIIGATSGATFG
jgi:hypothetical protein